ncbi:MAG: hypothetical protein JNK05_31050 [Myxococcales bacterium]|nr:hypothetical protein [Myxococcales bacterium]
MLTVREPTLETIPTEPGKSPFRIKGVAWLDTLARHSELPGGCSAVASLLPTPAHRAYYEQSFLPSGWYDVLPMLFCDAAAARVAGLTLEDSLRQGTRRHAHRVLSGIYRSFVRVLVPSAVAWALPRLASNYYDFGSVTTERVSVQHVRGTVRGVPEVVADWYAVTSLEFVLVALDLCGCVKPTLDWTTHSTRDDPRRAAREPSGGFALTDLDFDIRWVGTREA